MDIEFIELLEEKFHKGWPIVADLKEMFLSLKEENRIFYKTHSYIPEHYYTDLIEVIKILVKSK